MKSMGIHGMTLVMIKSFLVLINGNIAARHLTRGGALKHMEKLKDKGYSNVAIAYELKGKEYEPTNTIKR